MEVSEELIKIWNSLSEINETLGYSKTNISHCCLGEADSAYGYVWSYTSKDNVNYSNFNKIYQFTKDMELIKIWNSISDIENELGYHLKKILTGGNAIYFKNELSSFFYDPNFTLKGINYIYDINRE